MHRVFIGIPVDNPAQQQINKILDPIKESVKGIRWVPEHNRHLTLAFLGNRSASVIDNLSREMGQAYQQETSFEIGSSQLGRFPGSSGNIMALIFKADEQLDHLFQVTQEFLVENGFDYNRTQFRPHITLGRIRRNSRLKTHIYRQTNIKLQVGKITFYQSTLTRAGSIYLVLKETALNKSR